MNENEDGKVELQQRGTGISEIKSNFPFVVSNARQTPYTV